eukprot:scpid99127/ scgid11553/ 
MGGGGGGGYINEYRNNGGCLHGRGVTVLTLQNDDGSTQKIMKMSRCLVRLRCNVRQLKQSASTCIQRHTVTPGHVLHVDWQDPRTSKTDVPAAGGAENTHTHTH